MLAMHELKFIYFIEDAIGCKWSYQLPVLDGFLWRTLAKKNVEKVVLPMENIP